jgi:hypothetical protein
MKPMAGQTISLATSAISGSLTEPISGKSQKHRLRGGTLPEQRKVTVSGSMKKMDIEDITQEKLRWLIEFVDEMFSNLDENEIDTY